VGDRIEAHAALGAIGEVCANARHRGPGRGQQLGLVAEIDALATPAAQRAGDPAPHLVGHAARDLVDRAGLQLLERGLRARAATGEPLQALEQAGARQRQA
jgi:hypothetical protein